MDNLSNLKGRIGEAFVENVLCQARYKVSRLGRESQLQHMFKSKNSEFLPDFFVWKAAVTSPDGVPLYRLLCIEVKYRANIPDYLRRYGAELLSDVGEDWPELYVIFVTDQPDEGRSCFQLLHLRDYGRHTPLATIDLHEASVLEIGKDVIEEQTALVRELFSVLRSPLAAKVHSRKPLTKLPIDNGVALDTSSSGELRALS
jgi:hypothetical protein